MTMKYTIAILTLLSTTFVIGQNVFDLANRQRLNPHEYIEVQTLTQDSLASTFLIWIESSVKGHFHQHHTEHVYVIGGEGIMTIGAEQKPIKSGDLIFIPSGTTHAVEVTSKESMKVLSVQSPLFLGKDRVFTQAE